MFLKRIIVNYGMLVLVFRDGKFVRVLEEGRHLVFGLRGRLSMECLSERDVWIGSPELLQLSRGELLAEQAEFIDLKDNQRALVRIDARLDSILGPGLYGVLTGKRSVEVEVLDTENPRLQRSDQQLLMKLKGAANLLNEVEVPEGHVAALFLNGAFSDILPAGKHVFLRDVAKVKIQVQEMREQVLDIAGQEIMTSDKLSLRLNGVLSFRVSDVRKAVENVEDVRQVLYREAQLALRQQVGARSLDALLGDKEELAVCTCEKLKQVAESFGVKVLGLGIRDIILPGDMKELMNQVIEAQKAAEANVIKRREETAAMRSQLNTAKLMSENPVLMRLRELEVLETVAQTSQLQVVLGEQGLSDRLSKLI